MVGKLSTTDIGNSARIRELYKDFKDTVNYVNTTNRGYVRFEAGKNGQVKLAKVSKHWYNSWLINCRTNVDAAHNKQVRELFVQSLNLEFLDEATKRVINSIQYKNNNGKTELNETALSRIEIKNALEVYEADYNTKRADILQSMLNKLCTDHGLPDLFKIPTGNIDKKEQLAALITKYSGLKGDKLAAALHKLSEALKSKEVYENGKAMRDKDGNVLLNRDGLTMEQFQSYMGELESLMTKGIRVQKLKNYVKTVVNAALNSSGSTGFGEDGSGIMTAEVRQNLRSYLTNVMGDKDPNFKDGLLNVTNSVGDTLNVLDLFLDNIAGRILKQKVDNCLEYKNMSDDEVNELGAGSRERLIEDEMDISSMMDDLDRFVAGVKDVIGKESSETVKELTKGLGKLMNNAIKSTEDKNNAVAGFMAVRYANMGLNVRGNVISAVLNSNTDGKAALRTVGSILDDMEKGMPSFEKRVRVDDFINKFIREQFGGVDLDNGLSDEKKIMAKVKQRAADIKLALVLENGNVSVDNVGNMKIEVADGQKQGAKVVKRRRTAKDYNLTNFNSIVTSNLDRISEGYVPKKGEKVPEQPYMDKATCDKVISLALPKYLSTMIQKAQEKNSSMDIDSQVPIDLNPQHCFDALLTMVDASQDAREEVNKLMSTFKNKLDSICKMHLHNNNIREEQATAIYNDCVAKLNAILDDEKSGVMNQFFGHEPMNYEQGVNFIVNRFKDRLSDVVFEANKRLLGTILAESNSNFALRRMLGDSERVAQNFLDKYLGNPKNGGCIGNKNNPFITAEDKREMMHATLQKTYYQFLMDSLSGKKLTNLDHPVITQKYVDKIKGKFESKANEVIKNFITFEKKVMDSFDENVMVSLKENVVADRKTFLGKEMPRLSKKEGEELLNSMESGVKQALLEPCNALFKRYLHEPKFFKSDSEYIDTLLESEVFLADNHFGVAVIDAMNGHYNNTMNALYGTKFEGNLASFQSTKIQDAFSIIIKSINEDDEAFAKLKEENKVDDKAKVNYRSFSTLKETLSPNGELDLIDDELFALFHDKSGDYMKIRGGAVKKIFAACAKTVEERVKEKPLSYGIGTVNQSEKRITDELKAEVKKEFKKFVMVKDVFETVKQSVIEDFSGLNREFPRRAENFSKDFLTLLVNREYLGAIEGEKSLSSFIIQKKGVDVVDADALKAWIGEKFKGKIEEIRQEQLEAERVHMEKVEIAFGKFTKYIDADIEKFSKEELTPEKYPKLDASVLEYIRTKALPSLRGAYLTNLHNETDKYLSEERWASTYDECTIKQCVSRMCEEMNQVSFHDIEHVRTFLGGLRGDSEHPERSVFGEFLTTEKTTLMGLTNEERAARTKRNTQRKQAVELIRKNVEVWGQNPDIKKEAYKAQMAVVDRFCKVFADRINHNMEDAIDSIITNRINQFYDDFKSQILDGVMGMVLMEDFNEELLPAATASFEKWLSDMKLAKDSPAAAQMKAMFLNRVKNLQEERAANKNVNEPIFTIDFVDELLKIADVEVLEEKRKQWIADNEGKFNKLLLDTDADLNRYLNAQDNRDLNRAFNDDSAITKRNVAKRIEINRDAMQTYVTQKLSKVSNIFAKFGKYQVFDCMADKLNATAEKEIKAELDKLKSNCLIGIQFEKSLPLLRKNIIEKFSQDINEAMGVNSFDATRVNLAAPNSPNKRYLMVDNAGLNKQNGDKKDGVTENIEGMAKSYKLKNTKILEPIRELCRKFEIFLDEKITAIRSNNNLNETYSSYDELARDFVVEYGDDARFLHEFMDNLQPGGVDEALGKQIIGLRSILQKRSDEILTSERKALEENRAKLAQELTKTESTMLTKSAKFAQCQQDLFMKRSQLATMRNSLNEKMDELNEKGRGGITEKLAILEEEIGNLQLEVANLGKEIPDLQTSIINMRKQLKELDAKLK